MRPKQLLLLFLSILSTYAGYAQTNTATITQSGWYRIAVNGPLSQGGTGGTRAAARFILRDATSSLHQMVESLAYVHYGRKPSIAVLNNSYHRSGTPPFSKLRMVKGGTYEGAAVEVFVNVLSHPNNEAYYLQDNDQLPGWTAVNWQLISTSSGDNDGVPQGLSAYVINLQDIVNGFVTDLGRQYSNYNGNFYTSGNILLGKTSQTNTSYKLDVGGNIRADKVVVNTTGADYVFDSTYQLLPLGQLKRYVYSHNHLPDIPSAYEMRSAGLDVGENQMQLLKKIEELTLYQISSDEMIRQLKDDLEEYKHELSLLKDQMKNYQNQSN